MLQDNKALAQAAQIIGAKVKVNQVNGSNVISIRTRQDGMIYPAVSQLEAYWDALRCGSSVPSRADVDPRGLEDALEYAFILEQIAPRVGRFRVAGMHLSDLMGMEVRGMPLTAMFRPEARQEVGQIMETVCTDPCVATLILRADRSIGRPAMDAKMILTPLRDDFGDVNRVLGCLQSTGAIGRQPRRFRVSDVQLRHFGAKKNAANVSNALKTPLQADTGFTALTPQKRPDEKKRPALRLIKTDG